MDDLAAVQIFSLLSKSPSLAHLAMENASVIRSRLPPHPVVVPGPVVAIRVGRGKDEPVGVVEQVGVGRVVLHQLFEHPRGGGGRDPLTSVDPSVDPHCRLASTFTPAMSRGKENLQHILGPAPVKSKVAPANLGDPHRPALPALPNLLRCHKVELCLDVVEVGVPVRVEIYR